MTGAVFPLHLGLAYNHGTGELAPYFAALAQGRALASRCQACGRVWFPPHLTCPEDAGACTWHDLDGGGEIAGATRMTTTLPFTEAPSEHAFVLVAMTGADNVAFGRLDKLPDVDDAALKGRAVRLTVAAGAAAHPAQAAVFTLTEDK